MNATDGWHIVIPERGRVVETARALLALAETPMDVRSQRGGREFLVAPYVAEAYTKPKRPRARRIKEGA